MRTLTSSLLQAQKDMGDILCKIVLTSGAITKTYGVDTVNRLLKVHRIEQPDSQTAIVIIENADNNLSALNLEGYQCVQSDGYHTSAGDEYSAKAPLKVKAQELVSSGGQLVCQLVLFGIPDQMNEDKASTTYAPTSDDTKTVKTLINEIAGATLACYSHCPAITVDWDGDDNLIDVYMPKDSFRIYVGESRLAKIKWLLGNTKCVMIVKADGHIHIWSPKVIPSTDYDYLYNDIILAANHTFFSKIYRTRLVLPNKIVVRAPDGSESPYEGSATSAESYALLPKTDYKILNITSSAQATLIATAMIQRAELDHERGAGLAPMNVGQEVYDYVKMTDSREGDYRIGNVGYLITDYQPGKFDFYFGFGNILLGALIGMGGIVSEQPFVTYAELIERERIWVARLEELAKYLLSVATTVDMMQESVPRWWVTERLRIPVV